VNYFVAKHQAGEGMIFDSYISSKKFSVQSPFTTLGEDAL
jgi:hypothetical protein